MATLIPSLNSCLSKMTAGEKRFAQRLKRLLSDDCLCWFDIPVGKQRKRPDFIVLLPKHGLLVLEVKDWKAATLKRVTKREMTILTAEGEKVVDHPVEQARKYLMSIQDDLSADRQLREFCSQYKGKLSFPRAYGAVFSNISRSQLHRMIPAEQCEDVMLERELICQDEMQESVNEEDFSRRLLAMFNHYFGKPLTKTQINRIRWCLFPEIRVEHAQGDLFDEKVADAEVDAVVKPAAISKLAMPDIVRLMDVQQEVLARGLGEGHRVIHGVAGSGKTMILYHRCMYLAEFVQKPILVLCFNITLANYIRTEIKRRVAENHVPKGKVKVIHFHGWCKQQLDKHKIKVVDGDQEFAERLEESMINAVEQGDIAKHQYAAVLIDEGHDFKPEWLRLCTQMVDEKNPFLLLLYDDAQSIYRQRSGLDFSLASVGIEARGRTSVLKINYRNTQQIMNFAYQFAESCFVATSANGDIPLLNPEAGGVLGDAPVVKNCLNLDAEIENALALVGSWQKIGRLGAIAILYSVKSSGEQMAQALKDHKINCQFVASQASKKKYKPNADSVVLMPFPSSKGLEFERVILLDATFLHKKEVDVIANAVRRLYVAMTRAREQLCVSYHTHNQIAELLQEDHA